MTELPNAGDRYSFAGGNAITPITQFVTVVWCDGENVHYRKDGGCIAEQTTLSRFLEIARKVP